MSDFENPLASKSDDGDVKKKLSNGKKWTIGLGIVGILVMIYLYSKSKSSSSSTAPTTAPNAAGISSTMAAEQSGASAQAQLDQQMLQNAMSTSSVLGTSPGYTTSGGAPSSGYNINPGGQMASSGSGGGSSTGTTPSTTSTTPPKGVTEYMFSAPGTNNGVTTTISGSAPVLQGSGYNASTNPHYLALSNPTQYGMAVNRHAQIDYQPSLGTYQPSFGHKLAPNTTLFAVT